MTEIAVLIALVYALSAFNYSLGAVFRTLPVPRPQWRQWGPTLTWDASVSLFAITSVSAVQLLLFWISSLLTQTLPGPFSASAASFGIIASQLALVDTTLTLIVAVVSSTVVLSPVAEVLSRMFGPAIFWVTSAIILWATIALVISLFPKIWLWSYVIGVCFYALPFRLGRRLGAYMMASSFVVAVALPILPSLALLFQGFIGYEGAFRGLADLASQIKTNPLAIPTIIGSLPQTMATLMAAVIIALIVFPLAYLFALSLVVRSAVNLIGGGSSATPISSFFLGPSKQFAGEMTD